jgi:hypothetical protein
MSWRDTLHLPSSSRGAALIDVLTSMTFVLLLVGAAQLWSRALVFSHKTLEASATAREEAGLAVEAIGRDVRNAGFDAANTLSPIAAAARESLELVADFNGDGDSEDANERVRYAYRADRRQVTRASGRGSAQPFADDVPVDGLRFTFWDESDREIAGGSGSIDEVDLTRIRCVGLRLQIELPNPDPRAHTPIRAEASTFIALRNP